MQAIFPALLGLVLATAAAAQTPFDVRLSGRIDGPHAIPANNNPQKAILCAIYDPTNQMIRIGAIPERGFAATNAELYETTPNCDRGALISTIANTGRTFFDFIRLDRNQERLLFNGMLYVEVRDAANNIVIGGKIEPARKEQLRANVTNSDGVELCADIDIYVGIGYVDVDFRVDNGGSATVRLRRGTASNPGPIVRTFMVTNGKLRRTLLDGIPDDVLDDLAAGRAFLEFDVGQTTTSLELEREAFEQLAFVDGSQAGTSSQAFGKLFLNPGKNNVVEYALFVMDMQATSAELRLGTFGQNGPVIGTLMPGPRPNYWVGSLTVSDAEYAAINSGAAYVLVKSNAFPDGEIRGQAFLEPFQPLIAGGGCPGSNGMVPFLGSHDPIFADGTAHTFTITNGLPNVNTWFMIGLGAPPNTPFDLAPIGMPDCYLFGNVDILMAATTDGSGASDFTFNVPASFPSGFAYGQGLLWDPNANPLGLTVTPQLFIPVN